MFVVKDLAECWEECPKPDDLKVTSVSAEDLQCQQGDVSFLHRMGIRYPGDGES
jgi:hypothetical protein